MKWMIRLIIGCFFASIAAFADLPSPYCDVHPLRPFVDEGWYSNHTQISTLIEQYKVSTVIEVGSWLGQSTMQIAQCLPKRGQVHAIDHWKGSVEERGSPRLPFLYEQFLSNIIHARLAHIVVPHRLDSLTAARILSCKADLIYIDASHDVDSVYNDLVAWFSHLNFGGILCGNGWSDPDFPGVRVAVERFAAERKMQIEASDNFYRLIPQQ